MPGFLPSLQEISPVLTAKGTTSSPRPEIPSSRGQRLGRQAQLAVQPGFEEINPAIAPLSKATASVADGAPLSLGGLGEGPEECVAAFWAY